MRLGHCLYVTSVTMAPTPLWRLMSAASAVYRHTAAAAALECGCESIGHGFPPHGICVGRPSSGRSACYFQGFRPGWPWLPGDFPW